MRFEEHATGPRRQPMTAAKSLASATGIEVSAAVRHLRNGTASVLLERRDGVRRRPRSTAVDPKQYLLVLWSKRDRQ